jgi:GNAT superfamily N-acetyltransferase
MTLERLRVARRAVRSLYSRHLELVLLKELAPAAADPSGVEQAREIGAEDREILASFAARYNDALARRRLDVFLQRGYHGIFALDAAELAGYLWWVDRDDVPPHPHLVQDGIELEPADVYAFEYFLAPEFRGADRAGRFLRRVEDHLVGRGYRRLWGTVRPENRAARWLYAVAGYEEVRSLTVRRLPLRLTVAGGRLLRPGREPQTLVQLYPRSRRSRRAAAGPGSDG